MTLNFPSNPEDGQTYSLANGATYTWDGEKWKASNIPDSSDVVQTTDTPVNGQFLKYDNGAVVWDTAPNGVSVKDEGDLLDSLGTTLNFTGNGVVATGNGTEKTITITDTTYDDFTTSDDLNPGTAGLVPAPAAGDYTNKFLKADGSWEVPPDENTEYNNATTSADGLMSSADKEKLDGIDNNANNYSLTVQDEGSDLTSGATILNFTGNGVTAANAEGDGTEKTITITDTTYNDFSGAQSDTQAGTAGLVPAPPANTYDTESFLKADGSWAVPPDSNTTYNLATTTINGLMSSTDKSKLNGIAVGADVTDATSVAAAGAAMEAGANFTGTVTQAVQELDALEIDCSTGNYFTKTISSDSSFTVSQVPSGTAYYFTLELDHNNGTVTWFDNLEWPGGTAPTLTTGKTHLFVFVTDNGGSRWRGAALVDYTD